MTKSFKFALQPVLEHRKRIEEERQQELAAAQSALNAAMVELRDLNQQFRATSVSLREAHGSFDGEQLRLHYAHLEFLDRAVSIAQALVSQRKLEHEEVRLRLLEAAKEKKALEKLKGRRKEAHALAQRQYEQNEMDDSNARRYSRSSSGGTLL
ncbi:MAG: flagellar export protein FliJ [Candidatus Eremiobacteraeota bacterium]|nr:flagellar export protein FliJ [Candidatus Eremiobacteraeota bacterium]